MSQKLTPSVCIDAVFAGLSFDDAFAKTKQANITAIEFWGWWDKDLTALKAAQDQHQLHISACCTKFISLVDATKRDEYIQGLQDSIVVAKQLHTKTLISQVGDYLPNVNREVQKKSLIDGLKTAAAYLEEADITLVIEPLNELVDHPGYFLISSKEAFDIIDEVNSSHVKVLFDIYHQQISEGHLIHNIVKNIDKIGHFHAAGNPGRHELQSGEINYPKVFSAINQTHYKGYVGLEYWPTHDDILQPLREVADWLI